VSVVQLGNSGEWLVRIFDFNPGEKKRKSLRRLKVGGIKSMLL
jgi:hypothetical protein